MHLHLQKPYKSIGSLAPIRLPTFTIITGPNGSGKTHLLEAIHNNSITSRDIAPGRRLLLKLADFSNAAPFIGTSRYKDRQRDSDDDPFPRFIAFARGRLREEISTVRHTLSQERLDDLNSLSKTGVVLEGLADVKIMRLTALGFISHDAKDDFIKYRNAILSRFNRDDERRFFSMGARIAERNKCDIAQIGNLELRNEIDISLMSGSGAKTLLLNISEIFRAYHAKKTLNDVAQWRSLMKGEDVPFVPDDEFLKTNGQPPWELLNSVIQRIRGLEYAITHPQGSDPFQDFTAGLVRRDDGTPIPPNELSSGEKVLLRIAASLYSIPLYVEREQDLPQLVLLDEVDAALHPSMVSNLLELIQSDIVGKMQASVILVTHSPTTVALAPEAAIYRMSNKGGVIQKISRAEAVRELCEGIVVVTGNQRFVFVEGELDEHCFSVAARKLAKWTGSEGRELVFIIPQSSAAQPGTKGEASGVHEVRKFVRVER